LGHLWKAIRILLISKADGVLANDRFRALLAKEGSKYTIEKIAAKTGKPASFIARRLKLLDLIQPAADALLAEQIGVEHAQLIAKLAPDVQEKALAHCFDGYYGANDRERSLVPLSRLEAWIEQNVYLRLKSVPFSKDDETLLPEAGSCANCPKRTGFNSLLFSEVREDCCTDAPASTASSTRISLAVKRRCRGLSSSQMSLPFPTELRF